MLASIIIRTYNEQQHIARLLTGINKQTVTDREVIIVDSGSTDATLSIASSFDVRIIQIDKEDFSFGRSLNIGCGHAEGEFLVFASAHVYPVYVDWLENLFDPFNDPRVALVYGKQRGGDENSFSEHQIFRQWFPDKGETVQSHPFCNNANAAVRKSVWEKAAYNEQLTGLEDLDWAKRAVDMGHRIVYSPSAEIIHIHNETWRGIFNRYRREAMAMKTIYSNQKFAFSEFIKLFARSFMSDIRRAVYEKALLKEAGNILLFRFLQYWGTYLGFKHPGLVSKQLRQRFYYPNNEANSEKEPAIATEDIPGSSQTAKIDYSQLKEENQLVKSN